MDSGADADRVGADALVILPTYNEVDGLEPLLRATAEELERAVPGQWRLLVVDDMSPDGTGALCDRLSEEMSELEVLHRQGKAGLGQAYLAGFRHAVGAGAELVAGTVGVRRVEQRHARVEGGPHRVGELLPRLRAGLVEGHQAEADGPHLDAAHLVIADLSCLHGTLVPPGVRRKRRDPHTTGPGAASPGG